MIHNTAIKFGKAFHEVFGIVNETIQFHSNIHVAEEIRNKVPISYRDNYSL